MKTETKICGLSTPEALEAAIEAGATYVGLVFFEKSPRHVTIKQAKDLSALARKLSSKVKVVGLLVDPDDAQVMSVVRAVQPDYLQLHGRETLERVSEIKKMAERPIIKAIGVTTSNDVTAALDYGDVADLLLFDAKAPKGSATPGGNGIAFDWEALSPAQGKVAFMLSGGLSPDNVSSAIALVQPAAVDVSSGVEKSPGAKDPDLIRRFLEAVKTAKEAA
jgi:phosphoribosylanthranilate isomerase